MSVRAKGRTVFGPRRAALALLFLALVLAAGCAEEKSKAAPKEIPALGTPLIPDKYLQDLGGCLKYLDAVDKCIYNRATTLKIGQLCEPIKSPELRVTCLLDIAPMTGVRSLCLQADAKRDDCFEKMAVERNDADDCLQIRTSERQGICLKNLAVKYKTPAYCEKITVGGLRDSCFAKTAVDALDFEACGRIADDTTKGACQNIVGQARGIEAYCSKGEAGDQCFLSAAKQSDKEELCAKITGRDPQSECYAFFGKKNADTAACLKASGAQRDDCLRAVAKALDDLSVCQGIADGPTKRDCFETVGQSGVNRQVLLKLAGFCAATGDGTAKSQCLSAANGQAYTLDYCDPVADENRLACLVELNKIVLDRALCDKFADPKAKNECIIGAAGKQGKMAACDELKEQSQKFNCLKAVAVGARDEKICKSIELSGPGVQTRWDCLEEVARARQDAGLCMPINFKEQRGLCVAVIAAAKKDPGLCEQIKNDALSDKDPFQARDSCYLYLVHGASDKPLCDKVQDAARKEKCVAQAG